MPSLRDLQMQLAHSLFEHVSVPVEAAIYDDGTVSPAGRLAIYRNNLQAGFAQALALEFPVLRQLVGADYFRQMSLKYQREFPSRSGDLQHIGRAFPEFLERRFADTEFNYLPDVARLEWAVEEVALAPDARPLTSGALGAIDPGYYPNLAFEPRPACRLFRSDFPIVRIWLSNQPDAPEELIDLGAGGDAVAVVRAADGIEFRRLAAIDVELGLMLVRGMTLSLAAEAALACDAEIDLARTLMRLLSAGVFAHVGLRS
jgi:Putative DNA-binding domain